MSKLDKNLINKLKHYDVVSFDIYDTLVKRCVVIPDDIFTIVAHKFNESSSKKISVETFKKDRVLAGRAAKTKLKDDLEETTLVDIYGELPASYKSISTELMDLELMVEAICCVANPVIKKVYDWCLWAGKKIYIISDMYLPIEVVKDVLRKCGYSSFEKLYLSSDIKKRKRTGSLFDYFLKDSGVKAAQVVHIGDDIRNDYLQAKKTGIRGIKINKKASNFKYKRFSSSKSLEYIRIEKLIGNLSDPDWNKYFQYGFEVVGPALYGFTLWLHDVAVKENEEKLFFLSRDAYLMQKTYRILYGDKAIKNSYLYVSRKSMAPVELENCDSLSKILELETSYRYWYVDELCEKLGIKVEIGRQIWIDCGLKLGDKFLKNGLISDEKVKRFFEKVRLIMEDEANKKVHTILEYLSQEAFSGKVMIVDVGWAGTIQKYFQSLIENHRIDADLYGCYFGLKDIALNCSNIDSYIPKSENPPLFCSQLMEYPFTQLIGTTLGYKKREDGTMEPVLATYEYEGKNDANSTEMIQEGMMYFIEIMKSGYSIYEQYDYHVFYDNLKNTTKHPRLCDVDLLGNLTHVNYGSTNFLAKPRSLLHYLFHSRELKYDMSTSGWKIGFLKKLFKIPFPYNALLTVLRKV